MIEERIVSFSNASRPESEACASSSQIVLQRPRILSLLLNLAKSPGASNRRAADENGGRVWLGSILVTRLKAQAPSGPSWKHRSTSRAHPQTAAKVKEQNYEGAVICIERI